MTINIRTCDGILPLVLRLAISPSSDTPCGDRRLNDVCLRTLAVQCDRRSDCTRELMPCEATPASGTLFLCAACQEQRLFARQFQTLIHIAREFPPQVVGDVI